MKLRDFLLPLLPVITFSCGQPEPAPGTTSAPLLGPGPQQKLTPGDPSANSFFGVTTALEGDTLVVGAAAGAAGLPQKSVGAYVYTRTSGGPWTQSVKLVGSDVVATDIFGFSVALDQDTLVVGSIGDDAPGLSNSGSAYVFVRTGTTWSEQAKLVPSDPISNLLFGADLAVQGDTLVIGGANNAFGVVGRAYVFTRSGSTWTELQKLPHSDGTPNDQYGRSVAIDGDSIVVGAQLQDNAVTNSGGADVYRLVAGSWVLEQKLLPSDPQSNSQFGFAVDIDGNRALVGASGVTNDTGAVYVFERTGSSWTQTQKLVASDANVGDRFGYSVSLDQSRALVGSILDDGTATDTGAAYLFELVGSAWQESPKLQALDATSNDRLGCAVALDQLTAVAGACYDNGGAGSAYSFALIDVPGSACTTGASCASGFCVDGVCCDTACGGNDPADCVACSAAAGASSDGTCGPIADSTTCDDGDLCTQTDACQAGMCNGGNPVVCSPSDECHAAGACDPANGTCSDPALPDGTPCTAGTCQSGACAAPDAGAGGTAGAAGSGATGGVAGSAGLGGSGAAGGTGAIGGSGGSGGGSGGSGAVDAGADSGAESSGAGDDGGCGCRLTGSRELGLNWSPLVLGALILLRRRRGLDRRRVPPSRMT
jgi:hypothetical protein